MLWFMALATFVPLWQFSQDRRAASPTRRLPRSQIVMYGLTIAAWAVLLYCDSLGADKMPSNTPAEARHQMLVINRIVVADSFAAAMALTAFGIYWWNVARRPVSR